MAINARTTYMLQVVREALEQMDKGLVTDDEAATTIALVVSDWIDAPMEDA